MTTVCNQEEADTRIILHISLKNRISVNYSALNCLFSSIMIKTPSSDVIIPIIFTISIPVQVQHHGELRDGKKVRVINIRELACALGVGNADAHWMRLNVCHEGALWNVFLCIKCPMVEQNPAIQWLAAWQCGKRFSHVEGHHSAELAALRI